MALIFNQRQASWQALVGPHQESAAYHSGFNAAQLTSILKACRGAVHAVSACSANLHGCAAQCLHRQRHGRRQQQLLPAAESQPPHVCGRPRHPHEHRRSARAGAVRLRRRLQCRDGSRGEPPHILHALQSSTHALIVVGWLPPQAAPTMRRRQPQYAFLDSACTAFQCVCSRCCGAGSVAVCDVSLVFDPEPPRPERGSRGQHMLSVCTGAESEVICIVRVSLPDQKVVPKRHSGPCRCSSRGRATAQLTLWHGQARQPGARACLAAA